MRMWIRIGAAIAANANRAEGFSQSMVGCAGLRPTLPRYPREQEIAERARRRCVGDDQRVLKALGAGPGVPPLQECRNRVLVVAAREAGVDRQGLAAFQI